MNKEKEKQTQRIQTHQDIKVRVHILDNKEIFIKCYEDFIYDILKNSQNN